MLIEFVTGLGVIIGILVVLAEGTKKPEIGAFASVLLIIMAAWILGDGLQYKVGDNSTITRSGINPSVSHDAGTSLIVDENTTSLTVNSQMNTTLNETEIITTTAIYQNVPVTPFIELPTFFGLIFMLLGMYGLLHYVTDVTGIL